MEHENQIKLIKQYIRETNITGSQANRNELINSCLFIDPELYKNTRKNVEIILEQINTCYRSEIYDGCAVLIRKVLEMLLILSYKNCGIEDEIKLNGEYISLSAIIKKACDSSKLDLSKSAKNSLDPMRVKGNLSAHNPFYTARKSDLDKYNDSFRQIIEELLHKSGIIK